MKFVAPPLPLFERITVKPLIINGPSEKPTTSIQWMAHLPLIDFTI